MSKAIVSVALLASAALALPAVEVVQVRQIERRQGPSTDMSPNLPTDVNLSDLASLLPTDLPIPTDINLSDLASLLPTDLPIPTNLDFSSLLGGVATLLPSGCQLPSALGSLPTPPADVESALMSMTDYCHEPSFTGSVGAHYSSYSSAAETWFSSNGGALSSWASEFATACPYASDIPMGPSGIGSLLASYSIGVPSCASAMSPGAKETGSNSAMQTGSAKTGTASGTTGSPQSAHNTGAAPQQTAFAAVAGVVAGFVGVVAYL